MSAISTSVASACIAAPAVIAAPAPSIAGSWKGPFLGTEFTFEFSRADTGWTGRYQSEKYHKWVDLRDVAVSGDSLSFSYQSQPPSTFTFRIDPLGKAMTGSATFGPHPPLPLTLTRAP